jgi:predicted kinase
MSGMNGTIVAMAGLPGTGKSTVARSLAATLKACRLDKDLIRGCLIPPEEIDYSPEQNDFCMEILFQTAGYLLKLRPRQTVIIDGRPFGRGSQLAMLTEFAGSLEADLKIIECVCAEEIVRRRLKMQGPDDHPAGNRDFSLYLRLKAEWEPIQHPRLVLDTARPLSDCVQTCLAYLGAGGKGRGKGEKG